MHSLYMLYILYLQILAFWKDIILWFVCLIFEGQVSLYDERLVIFDYIDRTGFYFTHQTAIGNNVFNSNLYTNLFIFV
jgi:hypothetical protein